VMQSDTMRRVNRNHLGRTGQGQALKGPGLGSVLGSRLSSALR
jgi:hypothetical protein